MFVCFHRRSGCRILPGLTTPCYLKVVLEAGHTPTMIFQHYRALVTAEQAAEWFAIVPEGTPQGADASQEAVQSAAG